MLKEKAECYIDDLSLKSWTFQDHMETTTEVLRRLSEAGLMVRLEKCSFLRESVTYLGYQISEQGLLPGERKVNAVRLFAKPMNLKQLQSFHGLCSYFRRFVSQFAKIAAPLTQLFHKDTKWFWGSAQDIAFQLLKDALTFVEVLAYPDLSKPFFLHTDASVHGSGVCLMQTDAKNPKWHRPVRYASRLLLDWEKRYTVTELEALAVMFGLHYYKYMIQGCDIMVVTDHMGLKFVMDRKELRQVKSTVQMAFGSG